jgi:hypothetical protein
LLTVQVGSWNNVTSLVKPRPKTILGGENTREG